MTFGAVLVTGAAGVIGREVCRQLSANGQAVVALDNAPGNDRCTQVDIRDRSALVPFFKQPMRAVIHLAAILPTAARNHPLLATEVNIHGSVNLLELSIEHNVGRFVFGSSMGVYGLTSLSTSLSEDDSAAPEDIYSAGKRYIELYGEVLAKTGRLDFVALRIASVLGPGVRNSASPWRSEILERNPTQPVRLPFDATGMLSLIHAEDVARMLITLATSDHPRQRIYNSPAENLTVAAHKALYDHLHPASPLLIEEHESRLPPPVSDGTRFQSEFQFTSRSIADRLHS